MKPCVQAQDYCFVGSTNSGLCCVVRPYDRHYWFRCGVSLVTACKLNQPRLANFEKAFQSWIKVRGLREIIIVDWQSTITVKSVVQRFLNGNVHVQRIFVKELSTHPSLDWRIAPAFNLGLSQVSSELSFKVDCDTLLHPDFLSHNLLSELGFRYSDYRNALPDRNDNHKRGISSVYGRP